MTERRPPRRIRPLSGLAALAAAVLAPGCGFDSSATGTPPVDQPGDPDASPVLPVDAEPGACAEPILTQMLVGGRSPEDGADPIATVILGDTVVMSAAGSCTNRGTLSYDWQLGGALEATADPGTTSEGLTIYATETGDFPITLTLSDDVGSDDPITVNLRVLSWVRVAPELDVRDVAVGAGRIWIASSAGPRFVDLSNLGAGARDLDDEADGVDLPADLSAVFFDADDGLVWFGRRSDDDNAYRLDLDSFAFVTVAFPPPPFPQTVVRDITSQGDGVMFATEDGVAIAPDNETFAAPIDAENRAAVGDNQAGGWAGSNALIRLSDDEEFTPFGGGDNRILAIAGDDDLLWIGGDDKGAARMNADLSFDVFRTGEGLPSNRVRGLAVDRDRDVWAATQAGAARYKSDRDVWLPMGEEAGLDGVTDLLSVATGVEGGRTVVVVGGGPQGLAVLGP